MWVVASTPKMPGDQIDAPKSQNVVQTALWIDVLLPCQRGSSRVDIVASKNGMCSTIGTFRMRF